MSQVFKTFECCCTTGSIKQKEAFTISFPTTSYTSFSAGHYMSPESALAHHSNSFAPPSSVIEMAYRSANVALEDLAEEVLLPVDEVEMWLNYLKLVSENQKRDAAKAAAKKI